MFFISCKMQYRIADHNICKRIWKRHSLDKADLKIAAWQSGLERAGQAANMLDTLSIRVECKYIASFAEQMYQIAPIPASGVQHAHIRCDVSPQYLIEYIDINLPKLFLN